MRDKDLILREVGNAAKESPRSGIIPDLADVLMIEVLIDIRDVLEGMLGFLATYYEDGITPK